MGDSWWEMGFERSRDKQDSSRTKTRHLKKMMGSSRAEECCCNTAAPVDSIERTKNRVRFPSVDVPTSNCHVMKAARSEKSQGWLGGVGGYHVIKGRAANITYEKSLASQHIRKRMRRCCVLHWARNVGAPRKCVAHTTTAARDHGSFLFPTTTGGWGRGKKNKIKLEGISIEWRAGLTTRYAALDNVEPRDTQTAYIIPSTRAEHWGDALFFLYPTFSCSCCVRGLLLPFSSIGSKTRRKKKIHIIALWKGNNVRSHRFLLLS